MTRVGFIEKALAVFVACGMFGVLLVTIVVIAPLLLLTFPLWRGNEAVFGN